MERTFPAETAAQIRGIRSWITNESTTTAYVSTANAFSDA